MNSSSSSADRFAVFAERFCGLRLEPFQRVIAGEVFTARHELLVTIEENVLSGGFGSAVLEHLEDAFAERESERARVMRIGLPDRYVTHGKPALLREEVGFTGEAVAERVLSSQGSRIFS